MSTNKNLHFVFKQNFSCFTCPSFCSAINEGMISIDCSMEPLLKEGNLSVDTIIFSSIKEGRPLIEGPSLLLQKVASSCKTFTLLFRFRWFHCLVKTDSRVIRKNLSLAVQLTLGCSIILHDTVKNTR